MSTLADLLKEKLGSDVDLTDLLDAASNEAQALVESKTQGLVKNRDSLLSQVNKLKKNQIPEDFDINDYNNFMEEKTKLESEKSKAQEERLAAAGEWDTLKKQMMDNHAAELQKINEQFNGQIGTLKSALDKELIENVAIKAIEKEKGNTTLLLPHIKPNLKTFQDENGQFSTQVVDAQGNQRFNTSNGEPFTINDLVAEFKANDSFSGAFMMQNSGSGLPAGTKGKGTSGMVNPWKADTRNITEQAKLMRENPTLATQLQKAAGK